jgi:hypothetical protein
VARPHPGGKFTGTDHERLEWMLTRLRHHVHHDGLRPEHVPSMLPRPVDAPAPGPGAWLSRTRAATALYLLIAHAIGSRVAPEAAMDALGVHGIPTCALIDAVRTAHVLRERDTDVLNAAVDQLIADGLVDYQRRRDPAPSRLPTSRVSSPFSCGTHRREPCARMNLDEYTRGPMHASQWPTTDRASPPTTGPSKPSWLAQQLLADADVRRRRPGPRQRRYG